MGLRQYMQVFLIAASAATAQVQPHQSAGDPNNPNNPQNADTAAGILNHGGGIDQGNVGPFPTPTDKQFVQLTVQRAMLEIQLGQMAADRGTTPAVKALGSRMVADYTKWQKGLTKAAARLEITAPTELDANRKAIADRLSALQGAEFDAAYVKEATSMQNRALTITQNEATNSGVSGLRNWAGLMMPTLDEHGKLAKEAMASTVAAK